jgi:hypothetical protein
VIWRALAATSPPGLRLASNGCHLGDRTNATWHAQVAVGATIRSIVTDATKDVVVEFFAP